MGQSTIQSEVLAELAKMEKEPVSNQENSPEEVEKVEEVKENQEDSSSNQDVDVKDDGATSKKQSGFQKRIDQLNRKAKEAEERAENEAKLRLELEERLKKLESNDNEEDEVELDEAGRKTISRLAKEQVEAILAERDRLEQERSVKKSQEEFVNSFQQKVIKDYSKNFDADMQAYDDVATEEITSLFNKVTKDPEYWLEKINKYGAKSTYDRFIKEDFNETPKKVFPVSPKADNVVVKKNIDMNLSSKEYAEEAARQALEQLNNL